MWSLRADLWVLELCRAPRHTHCFVYDLSLHTKIICKIRTYNGFGIQLWFFSLLWCINGQRSKQTFAKKHQHGDCDAWSATLQLLNNSLLVADHYLSNCLIILMQRVDMVHAPFGESSGTDEAPSNMVDWVTAVSHQKRIFKLSPF